MENRTRNHDTNSTHLTRRGKLGVFVLGILAGIGGTKAVNALNDMHNTSQQVACSAEVKGDSNVFDTVKEMNDKTGNHYSLVKILESMELVNSEASLGEVQPNQLVNISKATEGICDADSIAIPTH